MLTAIFSSPHRPLSAFFGGKRVLVTGHTGFKGSWLSLWLQTMGAEVHGLALRDGTDEDLYAFLPPETFSGETIGDVADAEVVSRAFEGANPEIVFHLAAQPLVRRAYREPRLTIMSNVVGTMNVLEAIRERAKRCVAVMVTSDKCYENLEKPWAYREEDRLGGHDVYSASKAAADIMAAAWAKSFFEPAGDASVRLATGRAGNVIGGGDYAEDRIVPDCVRALSRGQDIEIRKPQAIRPWQHVLDCLHGYLMLARWLGSEEGKGGESFNFGPNQDSCHPVRRLVQEVLKSWPGEAKFAGRPDDPHEATTLLLSAQKAILTLGWRPVWDFETAVGKTVAWYRHRHEAGNSADMVEVSRQQIRKLEAAAAALVENV